MNNKWKKGFIGHFLALTVMLSVIVMSGFSVPSASAQKLAGPVTPQDVAAIEKQLASLATNQVIVQYKFAAEAFVHPDAAAQMERVSQAAGVPLQYSRAMSGDAHVLRLSGKMAIDQVNAIAAKLMTLPEVANAEADIIMYHTVDPTIGSTRPLMLVPNDPKYSKLWGMKGTWGINAPAAWNITTGSSSVVVAVIDTGITSHAEFTGRTVAGYDFIADPLVANDGGGRDSNPSDPGDWITTADSNGSTHNGWFYGCPVENSSWHGTHTAGTIGATGNNGQGVAGVNWLSKIQAVRVLGKCGGYFSDIVDGMRWAAGLSVSGVPANTHPAKVLSISLGGYSSCSATMQTAVNQVVAAGAVIVVSAGNSSADVTNYAPANCNGVITVSATGPTGDLTYYSNYGSKVEISAPGGEMSFNGDPNGVLSSLNTGMQGPVGDTYVYYQGTSMAAPHVSGVASLLFSINPNLTPTEVLQIIQGTAKAFPGGAVCTTTTCGKGIVDAAVALEKAIITVSGNAGAAGVKLSYVDGTTKTVTTDGSGNYTFDVPYHWSGTVTPSDPHYTFSPTSRTFSNLGVDQTGKNFTATQWWLISGNAGTAGATLTYTDTTLKTVTAGANGNYSLKVSNGFTGTVTVSKSGYTYTTDHIDYTNVIADQTGQNYTADQAVHTISGNAGVAGATISYTDGSAQTATTNSSGDYSLLVSDGFTGTLTPSKTSTTFAPANLDYSSAAVTTDLNSQNFVPTMTFLSTAGTDGWVLESSENSSKGGTMNSTGSIFQLGDDASNRQYRAILSFNTSGLPDNAVIQSAVLKIKQSGTPVGSNHFATLLNIWADIRKGPFGGLALQVSDFEAAATATKVSNFNPVPVSGWYTNILGANGISNINKTNVTQFRLYFAKDDNNNNTADYIKFVSGNGSSNQPTLAITFTLP